MDGTNCFSWEHRSDLRAGQGAGMHTLQVWAGVGWAGSVRTGAPRPAGAEGPPLETSQARLKTRFSCHGSLAPGLSQLSATRGHRQKSAEQTHVNVVMAECPPLLSPSQGAEGKGRPHNSLLCKAPMACGSAQPPHPHPQARAPPTGAQETTHLALQGRPLGSTC